MGNKILHLIREGREPDLVEADIPWGRHGLARGHVLDLDDANFQALAHEALRMVARLTAQLARAERVVIALRQELQAARRDRAA